MALTKSRAKSAKSAGNTGRKLASDPINSVATCGTCKPHSLANKRYGKPESETTSSLQYWIEERDADGKLLQRLMLGRHQYRMLQQY